MHFGHREATDGPVAKHLAERGVEPVRLLTLTERRERLHDLPGEKGVARKQGPSLTEQHVTPLSVLVEPGSIAARGLQDESPPMGPFAPDFRRLHRERLITVSVGFIPGALPEVAHREPHETDERPRSRPPPGVHGVSSQPRHFVEIPGQHDRRHDANADGVGRRAVESDPHREPLGFVRDAACILGCAGEGQTESEHGECMGEVPDVIARPRRLNGISARIHLLPDLPEIPKQAGLNHEHLSQQVEISELFGNHARVGDLLQNGLVVTEPAAAHTKHRQHASPLRRDAVRHLRFGPLGDDLSVPTAIVPDQHEGQLPGGSRDTRGVGQLLIAGERLLPVGDRILGLRQAAQRAAPLVHQIGPGLRVEPFE